MARILVVDDDGSVRRMLQMMLERDGHEAVAAAEGGEALRLLRERSADLVVTDILMPGKEGIELILELRQEFPGVRILAISGGGRVGPMDYLQLAQGLGAQRVLTKPLDRTEFLAAVRDLTDGR